MFSRRSRLLRVVVSLLCVTLSVRAARAELTLGDVTRIKGQEENTLHGVGLVVGLKGTGDGESKPSMRPLARYLEQMGFRVGADTKGNPLLDELKNFKNIALVSVSVTIPASGAHQGDRLDCVVSGFAAKSLEGGRLLLTEMKGPRPGDSRIYAIAEGLLELDDATKPLVARIGNGCQMQEQIRNEFVRNGKLTLVINHQHASFGTAAWIEQQINQEPDFQDSKRNVTGMITSPPREQTKVAKAIDQTKIEVTIPTVYADDPAEFVAHLLKIRYARPQNDARVIINERQKAIIVGADVEVAPVAVMHKNRLIQVAGEAEPVNQFVGVEQSEDTARTKLSRLVDALNALKVPAEDVIDIVKLLNNKRALFGELVLE